MRKYFFELEDVKTKDITRLESKSGTAASALGDLNQGKLKFEVDNGHFKSGKKKTKKVNFVPEGKHKIKRFWCGQYSIPEWEGKVV